MKFEVTYLDEKDRKVRQDLEAHSEQALIVELGRKGWRLVKLEVLVPEKKVLKESDLRFRWYWPELKTLEHAEHAIRNATIAVLVSAFITVCVAVLPFFGMSFGGYTPMELFDALFMLLLAYGLKRKSRGSALVLLVYFLYSRIYIFGEIADPSELVGASLTSGVFLLFYLHGLRGTFAYHVMMRMRIVWRHLALKLFLSVLYGFAGAFLGVVVVALLDSGDSPKFPDEVWGLAVVLPIYIAFVMTMLGWVPFAVKKPVSMTSFELEA